jgi:LytS/YehU family sensor histidine kinase
MVLIYCIIALLVIAVAGLSCLFLYGRKRHLAAAQKLQDTITSLKMQTIRNRMSPHFFFNTLSGISGGPINPENIKRDLQTLAMLLRRSVENIEQTAIPVGEELEVVKGYIDLQRLRVPGPFNVSFDIHEEVNMDHLVPAMIIQIPVENAIKHGLMPLEGEKSLSIKIGKYDGGLKISVEDNGIGYRTSGNRSAGTGTGLKILFQTICLLNSHNGKKIDFSIQELRPDITPGRGTMVEIKIPANYSYDILTDNYEQK